MRAVGVLSLSAVWWEMNMTQLLDGGNATQTVWGEDSGPTIWYVGVVLHLVGGALGSLGLNLQQWRYQHGQARAPSAEVFARRIWFVGFVLVMMDAVLTFLSYAFASVCKLATLGILSLCLNTSVAPACLKRKIHKWDKRGALLATVGALVAITCANPKTPNYSLDQLTDYVGTARVIASLCAANAILVGLLTIVAALRWQGDALEEERRHLRLQYQRMHGATPGPTRSPASLRGKATSGLESPSSFSGTLVTAPSEVDAEISRPIQPQPSRSRAGGEVALELGRRLQGGRAGSTGLSSSSGSEDGANGGSIERSSLQIRTRDDTNSGFSGVTTIDQESSQEALSGPASSAGSETEGTEEGCLAADDVSQDHANRERIATDGTPASRGYSDSRLRDRPEWSKAQRLDPRMRKVYLIVLASAAGLSAGLAVLFSKICVEMLKSTVMRYDYPYTRGHAYLFVTYTFVLWTLQIKLLNEAFVASNHSFRVVAHYQVVRLGTCIMGGLLFFQEAANMTMGENILFSVGCLMCVIGTLKMQGMATGSTPDDAKVSQLAYDPSGVGRNRSASGSVLGGANRDELDDMLHLLEIDTTTRNCEPVFPSIAVDLSCHALSMTC